ncbi:MAG: hypothetical protein HYZ28_19000 [Myxococcales bacterium]|nr:hypothetical protein [Myxococcales bacterium]
MPTVNRLALLPPLAALALVACPEPKEPPHLLYSQDPHSLDNPFPDLRLVGEGGMAFRPDWYKPFLMPKAQTATFREFLRGYADTASQVKGVGNFGPTLLRSSEPVDPSSIAGTAARLLETDTGYEVLEADLPMEHSRRALEGTGKEEAEGYPEFVIARPSVIIPQGLEGMLVVKRGLRTTTGQELGRGFAFEREKGARERVSAAARALSIPESDVLLALPLRAERVSDPLESLARWTSERQVPSYTIPPKGIVPDPPGERPVGLWAWADPDWGTVSAWLERRSFARPASAVGQVVSGTFKAKDLRENRSWKEEWVQSPDAAPQVELRFVLSVPKGARPPGGWPLVIGAHGMGGRNTLKMGDDNSFCLEIAEILARRGMGCIGIDAPSHGSRGNQFDFFAVDNLAAARENFRQMAFDQMQLSRVALAMDLDADGTPEFAPELGYFGNSLGGIMGASFVTYDPRVKHAVLNVPGGGLGNILVSDDIRDRVGLLLVAKTGLVFQSVEYYGAFPFFRAMAQLFMEPGDPINLGQVHGADRALLVQEGVGDRLVPNFTTEDLARAMGVPLAEASVSGSTPVRALFRADPAKYLPPSQAASFDGHNIFWEAGAVREQALRFLESKGTVLVVE